MWGPLSAATPVLGSSSKPAAAGAAAGAAAAAAAAAAAGMKGAPAVSTLSSASSAAAGGGSGAAAAATGAAAAAEQTVTFRQQKTPLGFLLSKAVDTLKRCAGRQIHLKELERMLLQQGFSDLHTVMQASSSFISVLSATENVVFNAAQKTISFRNPFQGITSGHALKAKVLLDGGHTGLRVDSDLLSACPNAADFVNELLRSRSLRAETEVAGLAAVKRAICMLSVNAATASKIYKGV
ncbi:hypothetical protein Efla_004649 [Eimeria flavescens]